MAIPSLRLRHMEPRHMASLPTRQLSITGTMVIMAVTMADTTDTKEVGESVEDGRYIDVCFGGVGNTARVV